MAALSCAAPALRAQSLGLSDTPPHERLTGSGGQDVFRSLACNWRGDIAAVGSASRGAQGGEDALLVIFDAQLNRITERHIGRQGDDAANSIVALPDGRYLLAGYSSYPGARSTQRKRYFGKRDAWALILDERGETERELLVGSAEQDEFTAAVVSPNGPIWIAGNWGDQAWILAVDADLKVIWEKKNQYHGLKTHVETACAGPDQTLWVAGSVVEQGQKRLWLAVFDVQGRVIIEKIFPASQAETATAIALMPDKSIALAGNLFHPRFRQSAFVALLDPQGVMQHYEMLGGYEFDTLDALLPAYNGQMLCAGTSSSFERGSRRADAWLVRMDKESDKPLKSIYQGSKLDDAYHALAQHPDGRILAAGYTDKQVLKFRQAWLTQLNAPAPTSETPKGELKLRAGQPVFPGGGNFAAPGERICVPLFLQNDNKQSVAGLRLKVTSPADQPNYLKLPGERSVWAPPAAAKASTPFSLPLRFDPTTPSGVQTLSLQLYRYETPIGEPITIQIPVGEQVRPALTLALSPQDTMLTVGQQAYLLARIHNNGLAGAQDLRLDLTLPEGLTGPAQINLGNIAAGQTLQYKFPVLPEQPLEKTELNARVSDGALLHSAGAQAFVRARAAAKPTESSAEYSVVVWVYPNPDHFDRQEIVWTQEELTVQVKIVSNRPINKQQFCIEINGEPCGDGVKFEEVSAKGGRNSKTFSQTVRLKPGDNHITAKLRTLEGGIASESLKVLYAPSKPNLHILSIGIHSPDLKFPPKDARDFARIFAAQPSTAFGKVFVDTLLTEAQTTKTEILKALRRLQYRYADLQIQPKDVLMVFVSAHGFKTPDDQFRIAAADYDGPFMQETSLDFERELVNYLQDVHCRKIFLIDACQSGNASGEGIARIASHQKNLNLIASCQASEFSYEDEAWQNGAFTHAWIKGIQAFTQKPTSVDLDADGRLTLGELFAFVQKETPALVEKKRPKPKTSQKPVIFAQHHVQNLILLEKK
ncbi:MAG: caspase family protein [Saprospiraceae bacterium]